MKLTTRSIDFAGAGSPPRDTQLVAEFDRAGWLACFVSFTMLLLIQWASKLSGQWQTTVVVLLFMAPWGLVVLRRPNEALRGLVLNWPLLALPFLALLSVIWSDYPGWTFRAAAQFTVTTAIGIWAGYCIKPRAAMSALLSALILLVVLSMLSGTVDRDRATGEYTLIGVFGSKNYFGLCVSLLLLTAVVVALDKVQPRIFRILGLAAICLSPPLLVYARSVGALVVSIATLMLLSVLRLVVRLPPRPRVAVLMVMFLTAILISILGSLSFGYAELLDYFGKDTTLTGRVLLWEYAINSIADQPVFGVGYQAFWQVGNTGAEQLWYHSYIPNKSGYHFHNTVLQIGVDLGLIGLLFFFMVLVTMVIRIIVGLCNARPAAEHMFAISIFIYLLLRLPIEVDLFFQFQIASILICMVWVYLRRFGHPPDNSGGLVRRADARQKY